MFVHTTSEWSIYEPSLNMLWMRIMPITVSTTIFKRGYFERNLIKSHLRTRLKLVTLDALMRFVCANIPVENTNLQWSRMSFFVTLDD